MRQVILLTVLFFYQTIFAQEGFVIDHTHTNLSQIPDNWIDSAKQNLKIRYFRRSHGSQIDVGGMAALRRYSTPYSNLYAFNKTGIDDELFLSTQPAIEWNSLDFENDTWVQITRNYLDDPSNSEINVVMWAWSSGFYFCDIDQYVNDMETLISEYGPTGTRTVPVTFIFQTACGQRSSERNEIVYNGNLKIRQHCTTNNRILFDFNDIECFDPDGNYYGDGNPNGTYTNERLLHDDISYISDSTDVSVHSGRGNWGIEWMNRNPDAELTKIAADDICTVCEHSDQRENPAEDNSRLHCVLKGQAAWWMWAVLAGWADGVTTNIEQKQYSKNVGDLKNYPNPFDTNTTIVYTLNENAHVKLELWNVRGQKIRTLLDQKQTKGNYSLPVNLDNKKGIYFYTLKVNGKQISNKMIKLK